MHNKNWDDIRFVLAVIESGTVSGAAKELGVNHATVVRRISAFEERQSFRLFEKTAQGYRFLPEHIRVIDAMREVAASISAAENVIAGQEAEYSGRIRVTSTDTLCHLILPDVLAEIADKAPRLQIDLLCANTLEDLASMRAEIAVRPTPRLSPEMDGEVAGELHFALYGPLRGSEKMISVTGAIAKSAAGRAAKAITKGSEVACVTDSFQIAARLASRGLGRTILPCFVGDSEPGLVRLENDLDLDPVPLWVISHSDLANVPRIVRLRRLLVEALNQQNDRLTGAVAS